MFDRARNLRRLGLVCLLATLGCKPDPVTPTTDPEPAPDAGGPASGAETPEGADADGADAGEADPSESEGPTVADTSDVTDAGAGQPSEAGDAPPTTTVATPVVATTTAGDETGEAGEERKPLPKPAHKLKGPTCQKSFNVGNKVRGFKLPSVDGKKNISPGNYRKRVVLLNFWGTWCKPCLKELPEFDRLYRKYRKHGLTLVAVATDEDAEPVQAFIDKHKLRAKIALEGEDVAGAYNRPNFPFSFVIDGTGKIIAAYEYIDDACMGDLEQVIRDELEKLDR